MHQAADLAAVARFRQELWYDGRRYFIAYGILAVEPLLLAPLLLNLLNAAELGVLGAVEGGLVLLGALSQLGVKFAYLQLVADVGPEERAEGFWSATVVTSLAGLLLGVGGSLVLSQGWVVALLGMDPALGGTTLAGLLLATNLNMMLVTDLRSRRTVRPIILSSLARVTVMLSLTAGWAPGAVGRLDALLAAQGLGMVAAIGVLWVSGGVPRRPSVRLSLALELVRYGLPIALGSVLKYGTDALLPWMALVLVSPAAAGALTLAAKTALLFDTAFGWPFLMAWGGRVYHLIKRPSANVLLQRLLLEAMVVSLGAAALAGGLGGLLLTGADGDAPLIAAALGMLPLVLLGRVLFILRSPASAGLLVLRRMQWHVTYAGWGGLAFVPLGWGLFSWGGVGWGLAGFVLVEAGVVGHMVWRGQRVLAERRTAGMGT